MRDCVGRGREYKYSQLQSEYHYTKDRSLLVRAMAEASTQATLAAEQAQAALLAEAKKDAEAAAKKIMDEAHRRAPSAAKTAHSQVIAQSEAKAKAALLLMQMVRLTTTMSVATAVPRV